jgi:transposase
MTKTTVDVTALLADAPVLAVFGGVDTHGRVHVAAAVDQLGRVLGTKSVPASAEGYRALRRWLVGFGTLVAVGIEGTGSYGAGLARALSQAGVTVVEVDRPDRSSRRRAGKDDSLDAISAAQAVASGRATGTPKARTGAVEAIRALRVARAGAIKARTAAFNQLKDLRLSAPQQLREELSELTLPTLARTVTAWTLPTPASPARPGARPGPRPLEHLADPHTATRIAMRTIGQRVAELDAEITALDRTYLIFVGVRGCELRVWRLPGRCSWLLVGEGQGDGSTDQLEDMPLGWGGVGDFLDALAGEVDCFSVEFTEVFEEITKALRG